MNPDLLSSECWKELVLFNIITPDEADSKSLDSINLNDLRGKPTLSIRKMRKFLKKMSCMFKRKRKNSPNA